MSSIFLLYFLVLFPSFSLDTLPPSIPVQIIQYNLTAEQCKAKWNELGGKDAMKCVTKQQLKEITQPLKLSEPSPFLAQ